MLAALYFLSPCAAVSTIAVKMAANTAASIRITHQTTVYFLPVSKADPARSIQTDSHFVMNLPVESISSTFS